MICNIIWLKRLFHTLNVQGQLEYGQGRLNLSHDGHDFGKIFKLFRPTYYRFFTHLTFPHTHSHVLPWKEKKTHGDDNNLAFSGATGIYQDNNFEKPLFLPTTLKNSVLIYKSTLSFYHGFQFTKLPKNVYRKTVNFQFFSKKKT